MDLKTIEEAVIARLLSKWPKGTAEFDIGKGFENILAKNQAISVTIERVLIGSPRTLDSLYELQPVVSVYACFKSVQPDTRRSGVYPMVVATAALLVNKDLGLKIEPFVPHGPIMEIYDQTLNANKMAAFKIDVRTAFDLDITDEETLEKLLATANDYLYREDEGKTQVVELFEEGDKKDESDG